MDSDRVDLPRRSEGEEVGGISCRAVARRAKVGSPDIATVSSRQTLLAFRDAEDLRQSAIPRGSGASHRRRTRPVLRDTSNRIRASLKLQPTSETAAQGSRDSFSTRHEAAAFPRGSFFSHAYESPGATFTRPARPLLQRDPRATRSDARIPLRRHRRLKISAGRSEIPRLVDQARVFLQSREGAVITRTIARH